jgi:histidinol-phosphate aminotransferase
MIISKNTLYKKHILESVPYKGGSTRPIEKDAGKKLYKLSSNENPLGPSPKALEAIAENLSNLHEYQFENDELLRSELSASTGFALKPDQFLTANSGMELLDLICRGFLEPGDQCILSTPTFLANKNFAQVEGACVLDVPLYPNDFSLDIDGILNAVTDKTKIIFISSPNNPCGSVVTVPEIDTLVAGLRHDVIIIYDEVYHHYVDHPQYARAIDYIRKGQPVIGLHSFSKAYGLAGIRLGYAFGNREMIDYLSHLRRPFMINTLSTLAGIAAIWDYEHLQKTVELVESEKEWLYSQLTHYGIRFWPGHANFILLKSPYETRHFATDMLQGSVMVRTGEVFGAPGCIRLTIGNREANQAFINNLKLLV